RTGDSGDAAFVEAATAGASSIYHCMNPPYSANTWGCVVQRWRQAMLGAAIKSGARVVRLDNLYLLGRPNGQPLSENSPISPCSRKGEIRAHEWQAWLAARPQGGG